jgi:hypothetical protein
VILRRLSQSLKQQNWTAIVIEFVLLVAGVFLGIQVSNWNQDREQARKAAVFSDRLRNDLRVEAWRFEALNLYYADVAANVAKTLAALEGKTTLSNEALVVAAYRATQYSEFVQYRATFDELTSTGNIGLIADLRLRRMATEVYGTELYRNVKNEGINNPYRVAFRMRMPLVVQFAAAQKCGDRIAEINDYKTIAKPLDYPCSTGLPQATLDAAAASLRDDAELPPLLRLRMTNIYSAVGTSVLSGAVLADMQKLAGKHP